MAILEALVKLDWNNTIAHAGCFLVAVASKLAIERGLGGDDAQRHA